MSIVGDLLEIIRRFSRDMPPVKWYSRIKVSMSNSVFGKLINSAIYQEIYVDCRRFAGIYWKL